MESNSQQVTKSLPVSQPVPNPAIEPRRKPSFFSSKRLRIGAVAVILIILMGGLFILGINLINKPYLSTPTQATKTKSVPSPTTDTTANWKTFSNNIVSFRYPSNWFVNRNAGSTENGPFELSDVQGSPTVIKRKSDVHTRVEISFNSGETKSQIPNQNNNERVWGNSTLVNDYDATQAYTESDAGTVNNFLITNPRGNSFLYIWFQLYPAQKDQRNSEKIFNQILSTFKYLYPTEGAQTWINYASYAGYSFEYPSDWEAKLDNAITHDSTFYRNSYRFGISKVMPPTGSGGGGGNPLIAKMEPVQVLNTTLMKVYIADANGFNEKNCDSINEPPTTPIPAECLNAFNIIELLPLSQINYYNVDGKKFPYVERLAEINGMGNGYGVAFYAEGLRKINVSDINTNQYVIAFNHFISSLKWTK